MFVLVHDSSENFVKAGISSTDEYESKENQQNIEIYTVSGRVVQKKWFNQYGVSIQSSTKMRETFQQITQKLWAKKTWDLDKLFKN